MVNTIILHGKTSKPIGIKELGKTVKIFHYDKRITTTYLKKKEKKKKRLSL